MHVDVCMYAYMKSCAVVHLHNSTRHTVFGVCSIASPTTGEALSSTVGIHLAHIS